jgi:hypothetical protein
MYPYPWFDAVNNRYQTAPIACEFYPKTAINLSSPKRPQSSTYLAIYGRFNISRTGLFLSIGI